MTIDAPSAAERHHRFPAVFNFRDLGGYPTTDGHHVRWRRVFRADGIHRLTRDDLAPLGIRSVVDLRTDLERDERGAFAGDGIATHHLPVIEATWEREAVLPDHDEVEYLVARYVEMLESGSAAIAGTFRLLADADALPLVFHCAAGKDRTGVTAAMLLSSLGVGDDNIAGDYALSTSATHQFIEWLRSERPAAVAEMESLPTVFLASPRAAMEGFLVALRAEHGSVERYLRDIGVDDATVAAVRANLLA